MKNSKRGVLSSNFRAALLKYKEGHKMISLAKEVGIMPTYISAMMGGYADRRPLRNDHRIKKMAKIIGFSGELFEGDCNVTVSESNQNSD